MRDSVQYHVAENRRETILDRMKAQMTLKGKFFQR